MRRSVQGKEGGGGRRGLGARGEREAGGKAYVPHSVKHFSREKVENREQDAQPLRNAYTPVICAECVCVCAHACVRLCVSVLIPPSPTQ